MPVRGREEVGALPSQVPAKIRAAEPRRRPGQTHNRRLGQGPAEQVASNVRQFVRLVEDEKIERRQDQVRVCHSAHGQVGAQEVVIRDDDGGVGHHRLGTLREARVVVLAAVAFALLRSDNREGSGGRNRDERNLRDVTRLGHPCPREEVPHVLTHLVLCEAIEVVTCIASAIRSRHRSFRRPLSRANLNDHGSTSARSDRSLVTSCSLERDVRRCDDDALFAMMGVPHGGHAVRPALAGAAGRFAEGVLAAAHSGRAPPGRRGTRNRGTPEKGSRRSRRRR